MGDGVRIQLLECLRITSGNGGDARLRIKDDDLGVDFFSLIKPCHQARPFIGRWRTAVRRWRQCHHKRAALEIVDFLFDQSVFRARDVSGGVIRARVFDGLAVVAKPRFKAVAYARGYHQPVVVDMALRGMHAALAAVDFGDLGLYERVAVLTCRVHIRVHQKVRIHHVDQPFVAERARPEHRIALDQHHLEIGRLFPHMTSGGHAAPAPAEDHHAALA